MALLIDPIIIILLVVITQSGHIPIALKVISCMQTPIEMNGQWN